MKSGSGRHLRKNRLALVMRSLVIRQSSDWNEWFVSTFASTLTCGPCKRRSRLVLPKMPSPRQARPVLVIIPTSFCESSLYDGQVKFLRERGHSVHVLDPPSFPSSYKPNTPGPSMYDDAKFITEFVTRLASDGTELVILAHGYGGSPASQSLKGLTKHERAASGKTGGVVRIAYLTAVVPALGQNIISTVSVSSSGGAPQVDVDQFGWMAPTDPRQTAQKVFNSLPSEQRAARSEAFGRHAGPAFGDPLTHPGYQTVGLM